MNRSLALAVLAAAGLAGCVSDESSETTPGPALAAGSVTRLYLIGAGTMAAADGVKRDFDFMWGPSTTSAFSGYYTPSLYRVHCDSGYVYVAGSLSSTAPPGAPTPSPVIVAWPTVVTTYVQAAADGTYFILYAEPTLVRIFRLSHAGSGPVKVGASIGEYTLTESTPPAVDVTKAGTTWTVGSARSLTPAEETLVNEIVATAAANGIRTP